MSLAKLEWRRPLSGGRNVAGILLHDLQLDFCHEQAMKTNASPRWHAQLLNGYLEATNMPMAELQGTQLSHSTTSFMSRPWWSNEVEEDGYIHSNLCRHLSRAELDVELGALLRDGRWTELRTKIGGVLALESDFEMLNNVHQTLDDDVRRGFKAISRAVQLLRGRMIKGLRVFQFHVCERLMSLSKSNAIVDAYIKSVDKYTPKPFLLPVRSFLKVDPALITKIPVEGRCYFVTCSPCGLYIAANSGCTIVVASSSCDKILKRLRGHTERVTGIAFAGGSKKIVSVSSDRTVMVWEWESSESPVQVLSGQDGRICSVSGGQNFFCSFGDTTRIWDMRTGAQEFVLPHGFSVRCGALSEEGRKLAIGFSGGRLKILEIDTRKVIYENTAVHQSDLLCMSFSPNGTVLATGSSNGTIRLWDSDTWSRTGEFLGSRGVHVVCIAFRADGKQLASISGNMTIRVWDIETRHCVSISPTEDSWGRRIVPANYCLSFIGDGKRIVAGLGDNAVRIWDPSIGIEAKQAINRLTDSVIEVAISRNGLQVVSVSKDRTVRLWDSRTGEQIGEPMIGHKDWLRCVTFSRDGGQLVTAGFDGKLRLWDTEGKSQIGDPFNKHVSVSCVSFTKGNRSADGHHIVSGSRVGTVHVCNAQTHKQIGIALQEHTSTFVCLSWGAAGSRIVSRDSTRVIIWNLENRAIVWKLNNVEENEITDDEAEKIIRESFPGSTSELYCKHDGVYCNFLGKKLLLADLPFEKWTYNSERKLFAAGMYSGAIAICELRIE